MQKNNVINFTVLNLFFVFIMTFGFVCGKSDGNSTGDNKSGDNTKKESTDKKSDNSFSKDEPFMVEFEVSGREKGNGTVSAIYHGKKCRSTSSFDVEGKKMSATAYFDGGDIVYTVSEVAGMKMGFKFDKSKFSDSKDNMDVNTFREYLDKMEKVGEEEIIGYKCEIYKFKDKDVTVSIYNKTVPLRMGNINGETYLKAKKLETDVKVTDDMFTAPTDVKYTDMSGMLEDMKKMGNDKNMKDLKDKTKELEDAMKNYKK